MIGKRRRRLLYTPCRSKSISLPLEKSNLQGTYSDAKKWFIGILYLKFMFRRKLFEWIFGISALCRDDDVCCRYRKKTTSHIYNRETQPRKMSTARALSTYKFKARRTTFYKQMTKALYYHWFSLTIDLQVFILIAYSIAFHSMDIFTDVHENHQSIKHKKDQSRHSESLCLN